MNEENNTDEKLPNIQKDDVDSAVADFCIEVIQNPLIYFSEFDLHELLVEHLKKIVGRKKLFSTAIALGKDPDEKKESKGKYKTTLVHREYGAGNRARTDVVIFDPKDVQKINNTNLTVNKTYLHPLYAFELGSEKTPGIEQHAGKDLKSLQKVKIEGKGYLLHIQMDSAASVAGTKRRDRKENWLKQEVWVPFAKLTEQAISEAANVRVLLIVLGVGRDQKNPRNKCEILTKISSDEQKTRGKEVMTLANGEKYVARPESIKAEKVGNIRKTILNVLK